MNTEEQKAISNFVAKMLNEGETIENVLQRFYKNVRFANSADHAKELLQGGKERSITSYSSKVIDFKVKDMSVTVMSHFLLGDEYVYVIELKNSGPMKLNDYYKQLKGQPPPQKEFREKIAKECGVSDMTVYRWLSGEIVPEKLKREKIAEITGLPVDELFPNLPDGTDKL